MPRKRRFAEIDSDDEFDDNRRPQRNAANERERARMRVLSKAFCRLKTTLPWVPADTKLSKLDTLRLATSYIAHLRAVLMDQPINEDYLHRHPLTLVSGFGIYIMLLLWKWGEFWTSHADGVSVSNSLRPFYDFLLQYLRSHI